jgi:hypothetical protein
MSAGGAGGAGTANQVRPPSAVPRSCTVVLHDFTCCSHGSSASTQPLDGDTKLADRTSSRFSRAAGAGPAGAGPAGAAGFPRPAVETALTAPAAHAEVAVSSAAMIEVAAIRNPRWFRGI